MGITGLDVVQSEGSKCVLFVRGHAIYTMLPRSQVGMRNGPARP